MNKNLFGFIYVSVWVLIWGTIGSLIDFPLLQIDLYNSGSLGQASTFTIVAIISTVCGVKFFSNFQKDQ